MFKTLCLARFATIVVAPIALFACSKSEPQTQPVGIAPPPVGTQPPIGVSAPGCPFALQGVTAQVMDSEDGLTIQFTGPSDEVQALQMRVKELGNHNEKALIDGCPCTMPTTSGMSARQLIPPAADVKEEDTDSGARLIFKAKESNDTPALRSALHMHLQQLQSGACGRM